MEWYIMIVAAVLLYLVIKYLTSTSKKPDKKDEDSEVKEEIVSSTEAKFTTREPGNSLLGLLNVDHVDKIPDRFNTIDDVTDVLRSAGLNKVDLIFGIDYTASNYRQGRITFGGKSLHDVTSGEMNPYQKVIATLGETLEPLSKRGVLPTFGFGDASSRDVFPLGESCSSFHEVLEQYNKVTPTLKLSGPTNFAPLIYKAISIIEETNAYHILVIVADGQVSSPQATRKAIVDASRHALSIIMIGVGDGPWEDMDEYDEKLPERHFDNFHFVDYHKVTKSYQNPDAAFAIQAFLEIPDQYKSIRHLGYVH